VTVMDNVASTRPVRVHPPLGLSPLFQPLPKGPRPPLDVSYELGEQRVLRFSAREALGAQEQTTMLAILELAGEQYARMAHHSVINGEQAEGTAVGLWHALHPEGGRGMARTLMLSCTWEELNRRCGVGSGGSEVRVRKTCLRRLCEVVIWEEDRGRRVTQQSYLVAWLVGDDARVHLALNTRAASAFFGAQFGLVSLRERLELSGDTAMVLHAFLSTCIRPGRPLHIGVEALLRRLWPGPKAEVPEGTLRRRRADTVKAVAAVGRLADWQVTWSGGGRSMATIKRLPGSLVRDMPPTSLSLELAAVRELTEGEKSSQIKDMPRSDVSGLFKDL
jgi:hypothetical protein